jgi:hypothetical protein
MAAEFASVMAGAASAHQAATATREDTSQQRAGRTRRTGADLQRAQQGASAATTAAPAALDSLSRLQQLADASPQVAQLQRLQALVDASPQVAQLRRLQALADASPQVAQLRRLQALADRHYAPISQLAGAPEEEELVQGQFANAELQPQLQQAPRANNTGLPDQLKSGLESLSGLSMDHVRVHYNSAQPAQLNALAYAQGSDIHLAPGQEQHLPHEAWHVVQQRQGRVQATMQMAGVGVNDDARLEAEADTMGAQADKLQRAQAPLQLRSALQSPRQPVVQRKKGYADLLAVKKRDEHEFLRTLFGSDFSVNVWKFPKQKEGDGIMGKNTISASYMVDVQDTKSKVALHINFMVNAGSFNESKTVHGYSTLTLKLSLLHITARSAKNQISIVENGPSILSAASSIHCGPNNDWDWKHDHVNVSALTTEINAPVEKLQAALSGYGRDYVGELRTPLKNEMTRTARNREVDVNFEEDNTWT